MSTKDPEDGLTDEQLAEQEAEQEAADRGDVLNIDDTAENLAAVAAGKAAAKAEGDDEEEEEEEGAGKDGKSKTVPHSRFNEVNEKRIRAEERAAMLAEENERLKGDGKAKAAATDTQEEEGKPLDVDAKEREYLKALMEGDEEKAFGIRKDINTELRRLAREDAEQAAETRVASRARSDDFAVAVADTLRDYPFLDSSKKEIANADAIEMVVALRNSHIAAGKTPAEALKLAAAKVGPLYTPKEEEKELTAAEKLAAKLKQDRADREAASLARNAKDAGKQPPSIAKAGTGARAQGAAPADVGGLDDDEFSKLSKKEKSDLRGDSLG